MPKLDYSHQALRDAESDIEAAAILYLQAVDLLETADKIAQETQSLRAIALAQTLRRDLLAQTADLQRFLSKQALIESGCWAEITADLDKYHLTILSNRNVD